MIENLKYLIILLLIFLLANCDNNPSGTQDLAYNVALSFVISPDSVRQKALLSYIKLVDDKYSNYADLVDSANFYVNNIKLLPHSSENVWLPHNRERYYNYYSDSLNLQFGDTLDLSITKNNITITGITIIPGEFTINTNGKTISWTKSNNAYYYHIKISNIQRTFLWETATSELSVTITDSDFVEDNYKIAVTSFDENYYDYYQNETNPVGIVGAYGVFSAVNRKEITTFLHE